MSQRSQSFAVAIVAGALFAAGLALSGMTSPANVVGFLNVTHGWSVWQPNLALVMAAAIVVYAPMAWYMRSRTRAVVAPMLWPVPTAIDRQLITGAAIFGVGWGLAGYCPGPSLVALGAGTTTALGFVAAMIVGMLLARLFATLPT